MAEESAAGEGTTGARGDAVSSWLAERAEARCPHCGAAFTGVRAKSSRLFGSHTLVVGEERPALEAGEPTDLFNDADDVTVIADGEGGEEP